MNNTGLNYTGPLIHIYLFNTYCITVLHDHQLIEPMEMDWQIQNHAFGSRGLIQSHSPVFDCASDCWHPYPLHCLKVDCTHTQVLVQLVSSPTTFTRMADGWEINETLKYKLHEGKGSLFCLVRCYSTGIKTVLSIEKFLDTYFFSFFFKYKLIYFNWRLMYGKTNTIL